MKKKIIFLFLLFIMLSCKSYQSEYNFVNNYLKDELKLIDSESVKHEKDTIYLIRKPITKERVFNKFSFQEIDSSYKIIPLNRVNWVGTYKLNDIDKEEIRTGILNYDENSIWNKKKIQLNKQIIITTLDSLRTFYNSDYSLTKKNKIAISFSKPIFNNEKDICFFLLDIGSNNNNHGFLHKVLILKKKYNKWVVIGNIYSIESH